MEHDTRNGRILEICGPHPEDPEKEITLASYEYDGDGNLTERYLGTGKWLDGKKDRWRYRWNADGSLAKVVRPDKRKGFTNKRLSKNVIIYNFQ